jgi:hypothetical protein
VEYKYLQVLDSVTAYWSSIKQVLDFITIVATLLKETDEIRQSNDKPSTVFFYIEVFI